MPNVQFLIYKEETALLDNILSRLIPVGTPVDVVHVVVFPILPGAAGLYGFIADRSHMYKNIHHALI